MNVANFFKSNKYPILNFHLSQDKCGHFDKIKTLTGSCGIRIERT